MKKLRTFLAGLVGLSAAHATQPAASKSPGEMMREMRIAWLTRVPEKASHTNQDEVVAVVMDWPLGDHTATVLSSSVGDASLYTTGTFGILGGIGHERVRKAAQAFVATAQSQIRSATITIEYPYPDRESLYVYMVTPAGVRRLSFPLADVDRPESPARALFASGQQVLTELRLITSTTK